jgi:hypothetical protein
MQDQWYMNYDLGRKLIIILKSTNSFIFRQTFNNALIDSFS